MRDVVPGILRGLRGPLGGQAARVREIWGEVVGEATALRTRVTGFENGRVRVEVASAALKQDLSTFRRQDVVSELRRRLPELTIRDVVFRVGAVS